MWSWWFGNTCAACGERLPIGQGGAWCIVCAVSVEPPAAALAAGDLRVRAAWTYGGAVMAAVHRAKSGQALDLGALSAPLAALLLDADRRIEAALPTEDAALVAVPPELGRLRERGQHLPDRLAQLLQGPHRRVVYALTRRDRQAPRRSTRLAAPVLAATVAGRGRRAVLVDDVVTTGTTLQCAAQALRAAGWRVDEAVVLADARPAVLARLLL